MEIDITKKQGLIAVVVFVIICLIFVFVGLYLFFKPNTLETGTPKIPENKESIVWKTYTDKDYGFEVQYPEHWTVRVDQTPAINFYPPTVKDPEEYYIHHDNVTHFSVYPLGIPTEGVRGETVAGDRDLSISTEKEIDYVLTDGKVWATLIDPLKISKNWKDWGFIWFGYEVKNPTFGCISGDVSVPVEQCDPYAGDQFTRTGEIDSDLDEIKDIMLKSFIFTDYE